MPPVLVSLFLMLLLSACAMDRSFRDCPDCPPMVWVGDGHLAVAVTETTRAQWRACVAAGACRDKPVRWPQDDMPMTDVLADDAEAYCRWLTTVSGHAYRLPSESEWQMAAQAGTGSRFPWGDQMQPGRAVCQFCDPRFDHRPAPVATMAANPWGLYDMNGNVWEWTADCWDQACRQRVIKGGSWYFIAAQSASASRAPQDVREWGYDVGFRVVRQR